MLGEHAIKTWSVTQAVIALSSGEAEYYGIVKGASAGLGVCSVLADLGVVSKTPTKLVIHTDSSAAKGISSRRGLGKVRHIEVNQLWIQDRVNSGEIEVRKVTGASNIADALTKHAEHDMLRKHVEGVSLQVSNSRHDIMPSIAHNVIGSVEHPQQCVPSDIRPRAGPRQQSGAVKRAVMSILRSDEMKQSDTYVDTCIPRNLGTLAASGSSSRSTCRAQTSSGRLRSRPAARHPYGTQSTRSSSCTWSTPTESFQSFEGRPVRPRALAEGECKTIRSICWFERTAAEKSPQRRSLPARPQAVGRPIRLSC